jgi:hypothetical protein
MKKSISGAAGSIALALALAGTSGCQLFNKGDQGGGEQPQQGQGGGDAGQQQQAPAMDPTQFVQAPGRIGISQDGKVGWMAGRKISGNNQNLNESYAIVGEAGDSFQVEAQTPTIDAMAASMPAVKGMIMGLTVRKADGVVTKAVLGKPGEAGKEIKIVAAGEAPAATAPQGTDERVTIGIGTFDAKKMTSSGTTTWVGTSGDVQNVLLKSSGNGQDYELAEMPKKETKDVNGVSVQVTSLSYSNGMKMSMTDNQVIACFFPGGVGADGKKLGMFRLESGGSVMEVNAVKTDAAAQLKW